MITFGSTTRGNLRMPNRLREVKPWEAVMVRPNSLVWTKKVHRPTSVVTEFHCTITPAINTFHGNFKKR